MHILKYIFFFSLLVSINIFGQKEGFALGIGLSPDYHHEIFSNDAYSKQGHVYGSQLKYSTGLFLKYQIIENIGISVGGIYARKGYELTYNWTQPSSTIDPVIPQKTYFAFDYFDFPLIAYLSIFRKEKLKISPSVGYTPSFLVHTSERSRMGNGNVILTNYQNIEKSIPHSMKWFRFSILVDFRINDNFFWSVEPYYTYNRNSLKSQHINAATNTFGLNFSINYWLFRKDL